MNIRKQLVTLAVTGALAGTGLIGTASTASAATCLGSAHSFTKAVDNHYHPPYKENRFLATSSSCADINIKLSSAYTENVKVCFYRAGGDLNYCQSEEKSVAPGAWKVIATDVADNVLYKLYFGKAAAYDRKITGSWAS
ncbi:hypothetical protein [Streptomyces fulvoviolaceus]|uniref:hypothetical protein n=1 Tax=Streptomyces fulvoviolaceus TaxID=285535 RepID=UPI0004C6E217|nr:hypothetical protein [Streptomyces fulvoviolaceus]